MLGKLNPIAPCEHQPPELHDFYADRPELSCARCWLAGRVAYLVAKPLSVAPAKRRAA